MGCGGIKGPHRQKSEGWNVPCRLHHTHRIPAGCRSRGAQSPRCHRRAWRGCAQPWMTPGAEGGETGIWKELSLGGGSAQGGKFQQGPRLEGEAVVLGVGSMCQALCISGRRVKGIPRHRPPVSRCVCPGRLSKPKVPAKRVICCPNCLYSRWFLELYASHSPPPPSLSALNQSSAPGLGLRMRAQL